MDPALRDLVATGPLCHLTTLNPDGSPQVTVVWVGADGDDLVTATSAQPEGAQHGARPSGGAVLPGSGRAGGVLAAVRRGARACGRSRSDEAWDVLDGLAKTYLGPDVTFPAPRDPGFVVRYTIERVGGIGPWAS